MASGPALAAWIFPILCSCLDNCPAAFLLNSTELGLSFESGFVCLFVLKQDLIVLPKLLGILGLLNQSTCYVGQALKLVILLPQQPGSYNVMLTSTLVVFHILLLSFDVRGSRLS